MRPRNPHITTCRCGRKAHPRTYVFDGRDYPRGNWCTQCWIKLKKIYDHIANSTGRMD